MYIYRSSLYSMSTSLLLDIASIFFIFQIAFEFDVWCLGGEMSPHRLAIIGIWTISILLRVLFVGCYSIFKSCGLAEGSVVPGVGFESLQPHPANGSFSLLYTCSCWCNLSALPWPQLPGPSAIMDPLSDTVAQIHFFWSYLWSWCFATAAERWLIECERFAFDVTLSPGLLISTLQIMAKTNTMNFSLLSSTSSINLGLVLKFNFLISF